MRIALTAGLLLMLALAAPLRSEEYSRVDWPPTGKTHFNPSFFSASSNQFLSGESRLRRCQNKAGTPSVKLLPYIPTVFEAVHMPQHKGTHGWSGPKGEWVQWGLHWPQTLGHCDIRVDMVKIGWIQGTGGKYSYEIQISPDQKSWKTVASGKSTTHEAMHAIELSGDDYSPEKWVRIVAGDGGMNILVVEFWGSQRHNVVFNKPGLMWGKEITKLHDRIKNGEQPWTRAYRQQSKIYKPQEVPAIEVPYLCEGSYGYKSSRIEADNALHNAIFCAITRDQQTARTTADAIKQWCDSIIAVFHETGEGGPPRNPNNMNEASHIIRAVFPDLWTDEHDKSLRRFNRVAMEYTHASDRLNQNYFVNFPLKPNTKSFLEDRQGNMNNHWGDNCMALMGYSISNDDLYSFNWAVAMYKYAMPYCNTEWGQNYETTRDLVHCGQGINAWTIMAEFAWHQGVDLYGFMDSRVLTVMEYHAALSQGRGCELSPMPFDGKGIGFWPDGKMTSNDSFSGSLGGYLHAYNHYHNRLGMELKYLQDFYDRRPVLSFVNFGSQKSATINYPGSEPQKEPDPVKFVEPYDPYANLDAPEPLSEKFLKRAEVVNKSQRSDGKKTKGGDKKNDD